MASTRLSAPARAVVDGIKICRRPSAYRTLTTDTTNPNATISQAYMDAHLNSAPTEHVLNDNPSSVISSNLSRQSAIHQPYQPPSNPFRTTTQVTLHAFPTLEPTRLLSYPSTHLSVPLRKDILHRAIIYEADAHRQGSANTKHRSEVHGSGRKIRPQKGSGKARLGDKKSPMLRGGGVAFGPKPRSFKTGLQEKVYDLAWRTALSYRYSRGELMVLDSAPDVPEDIQEGSRERWMRDLLLANRMGAPDGRTLFLTVEKMKGLWEALKGRKLYGLKERKVRDTIGDSRHARALTVDEVDVKDLLEGGRVVVEQRALDWVLRAHESDLNPTETLGAWRRAQQSDGSSSS